MPRKPLNQRKKPHNKNQRSQNEISVTVPRSRIVNDASRTRLVYWKAISFDFSTGSSYSVRFRPSNCFDVDPTASSTTMPGFAEFAAFYGKFRLLASTCTVEATNSSAIRPVKLILCPQNTDPGGSPSGTYIERLLEQPYAQHVTAGLIGSPVVYLHSSMTTQKINGTRATLYDDAQVGSTFSGVGPTNDWFWVVGAYSFGTGATFSAHIRIECEVEFFDRRDLPI